MYDVNQPVEALSVEALVERNMRREHPALFDQIQTATQVVNNRLYTELANPGDSIEVSFTREGWSPAILEPLMNKYRNQPGWHVNPYRGGGNSLGFILTWIAPTVR